MISKIIILYLLSSCVLLDTGKAMTLPIDHDDMDSLHCYCSKEHYTTAKIINRSLWYSVNESKMQPYDYTKINRTNDYQNLTVKGDITLTYNLFTDCYYVCKMPILYNEKFRHFILDHLDAYYKVGGYLNLMCNSTMCSLGNQNCYIVNVKDEL